jgi:hypothetical protein
LFSQTGRISASDIGFIVSLTEIYDAGKVRFIVTGQGSQETFVYFSMISQNFTVSHYSFATNDANFRWDPSVSLLRTPLAVAANCLSSIKIIAGLDAEQVRLFEFDVEAFLSRQLGETAASLDSFEVSIIEKDESRCSVIIVVRYLYYREENGKWFAALSLLEVLVDGKRFRGLHRESFEFSTRPSVSRLRETTGPSMEQFKQVHIPRSDHFSFVTTEYRGDVRSFSVPEFNAIIVDDTVLSQSEQ